MIGINLDKAKDIAHRARRRARDAAFAPLDIKATIRAEAKAAEAARQHIRDSDADLQDRIDAADHADQLIPLIADITSLQ